uniref:Uncharacterized protein n=1 Tax=Knipowitschia caucasica TaxID=637954 RepID=A0AAV2JMV7_KNICA
MQTREKEGEDQRRPEKKELLRAQEERDQIVAVKSAHLSAGILDFGEAARKGLSIEIAADLAHSYRTHTVERGFIHRSESKSFLLQRWTHYASSTLVPHSHPKRSPLSTTNSSSFLDSEFRYALSPPIYG